MISFCLQERVNNSITTNTGHYDVFQFKSKKKNLSLLLLLLFLKTMAEVFFSKWFETVVDGFLTRYRGMLILLRRTHQKFTVLFIWHSCDKCKQPFGSDEITYKIHFIFIFGSAGRFSDSAIRIRDFLFK